MTVMEYEVMQAVESIDDEVLTAEFAVLDAMYNEYSKALTLIEYCEDETALEQFDIFAEADGDKKDDGDELTEGGFWKKKDNTVGKKILAFIPRLFQALGRLIQSVFKKTPKESAEEVSAACDAAAKAASTEAGAELSAKIEEFTKETEETEETVSVNARSFTDFVGQLVNRAKEFYEKNREKVNKAAKVTVGVTAAATAVTAAAVIGGKENRSKKFQNNAQIQELCKQLHGVAYVNARQRKGYVTLTGYKPGNLENLAKAYEKIVDEIEKKPNKHAKYAEEAKRLAEKYLTTIETKSYSAEDFSKRMNALRITLENGQKKCSEATGKLVEKLGESEKDQDFLQDILETFKGISNIYTNVTNWVKDAVADIATCRHIWEYLNGTENDPKNTYGAGGNGGWTNGDTARGNANIQGYKNVNTDLQDIDYDPQGLKAVRKQQKTHNASPEVVNQYTTKM